MKTAEEGVPIASPSGMYSATVFSNARGDCGNTQVIVECPSSGSGSGVFTLDLPHVPLRVWWENDSQLIISHPREIRARAGDALAQQHTVEFANPAMLANISQQIQHSESDLGPENLLKILKDAAKTAAANSRAVHIRYEGYVGAADEIRELRRKADESAEPQAAPNLLEGNYRGRLFAVGDGRYALDYYDTREPDSMAANLASQGYQGGGESWAGIVYGLLKLRAPDLLQQIQLDPEADGLRSWSSNQAPLAKVAQLITEAHADQELLHRAIAAAEADSQME